MLLCACLWACCNVHLRWSCTHTHAALQPPPPGNCQGEELSSRHIACWKHCSLTSRIIHNTQTITNTQTCLDTSALCRSSTLTRCISDNKSLKQCHDFEERSWIMSTDKEKGSLLCFTTSPSSARSFFLSSHHVYLNTSKWRQCCPKVLYSLNRFRHTWETLSKKNRAPSITYVS